jgi:hypothetical protein
MLAILASTIFRSFLVSNKAFRQNLRKTYPFTWKKLNCFIKMDLIDHCAPPPDQKKLRSILLQNAKFQLLYTCSVNDRSRFIRRLFAKRKLTQTSHIVQYCRILPDRVLLYGPKIRGSMLVSLE